MFSEYRSLLDNAVLEDDIESVRFLLAGAADPNETSNNQKRTPLHLLAKMDKIKPQALDIAEELLCSGANPLLQDESGNSPLHYAFWNLNSDLAALILKEGLPKGVNPIDSRKLTAFHIACVYGDLHDVRQLLKSGAKVEDCIGESSIYAGFNAFHLAVAFNRRSTVEFLLDLGADVNKATKYGRTALHLACMHDDTSMVNMLLDKGANIEATDDNGITPLLYICSPYLKHHETLPAYERMFRSREFLGSPKLIKCLLDRGASVHARHNQYNTNVLHHINYFREDNNINTIIEIAELLIKHGADVNAQDSMLWTPLHYTSTRHGQLHMQLINVLVKHGADIDAQNNDLQTPLHTALCEGNESYVNKLLKLGADVNARDANLKTPLHIASQRCLEVSVEVLLEFGANVDNRDVYGLTPINVACCKCYVPPRVKLEKIDRILDNLYMHVERLLMLGLPVDEKVEADFRKLVTTKVTRRSYEEKMRDTEIGSIETECADELERMREVLVDAEASLYRLLRTGRYETGQTLNDSELESIMKNFEVKEKYPNYAYILQLQVRRAHQLEIAEAVMRLLANCELPSLCCDVIFNYLENKDIKNLASMGSIERVLV